MKAMKFFFLLLISLFCISQQVYADKQTLPKEEGWDKEGERNNSSPQLLQEDNYVYVYSEKQLDNLYIGITDMQGNIFYEEITIVPAGQYYAIPINTLPNGMYYLSVILGDGVETLTVSSW